jgi:hypothetical protein
VVRLPADPYGGVTVSEAIDDVRALMESRLAEIEAESRRLERAVAIMRDGTREESPRPRRSSEKAGGETATSSKPRRRGGGRKTVGRAARSQRRAELLAAIGAAPGARPSKLARTMKIKLAQAHALISKARAEKLVAKSGKGYALTGKGTKAAG